MNKHGRFGGYQLGILAAIAGAAAVVALLLTYDRSPEERETATQQTPPTTAPAPLLSAAEIIAERDAALLEASSERGAGVIRVPPPDEPVECIAATGGDCYTPGERSAPATTTTRYTPTPPPDNYDPVRPAI